MPGFSRRTATSLVLAALLAPPHALAQSVSSTVAGTVVDQTRQSLPRATVSLVNELTGDQRATETNETGAFVFAAVQPATYTVKVELSGFTTYELRNTAVPPNEQLSIGRCS